MLTNEIRLRKLSLMAARDSRKTPLARLIEITHPLTYKLRGQQRFAHYRRFQQQQFTTAEQILEYQLSKLRALLSHAQRTVPYYRELFRGVGFEAGDLKTLADYSRLPILTRDDVKAHLDEMVSSDFNRDELIYSATGGSTGTPMNYYQTADYLEASEGVWMRSFTWVGKMPADTMLKFVGTRMDFDKGWFGPAKRVARFLVERTLFLNAFDINSTDLAYAIKLIRRFRPSFYYGYASSISLLAKYVHDAGISLPQIQAVVTSAEKLYPEQRALIEEVFQAPAYSFYGSREVRNIAAMCRRGNLHQAVDWVYTEFAPVPESPNRLRIVVTPLESFAMPLIRYANNDLGTPVDGTCPCGNIFPLMGVGVGRTTDMFVTPEGRVVHGEYFTHLLYGIVGVRCFQFHQTSLDTIALRVVREACFTDASRALIDKALDTIRREVSQNYILDLQFVEEIPLSPMGKFLFTRSDISQDLRGMAGLSPTAPVRQTGTAL